MYLHITLGYILCDRIVEVYTNLTGYFTGIKILDEPRTTSDEYL